MHENWNSLFFYLTLPFSIVLLGYYMSIIKQKKVTVLWIFSFFCFISLFFCALILFVTFSYGKFLVYFLFKEYNLQMVLRDPQELLEILFGFAFWVFILLFLFLFLFYTKLVLSNFLRREEYAYFKFFQILFLYFISLSLILFIYDLSSFHTDVFSQQSQFKFEPDILKWYSYYESEYIDFLLFLLLTGALYTFIFSDKYSKLLCRLPIFKFLPLFFFIAVFCYFFGGESIIRDIALCFFSFIFSEVLTYTAMLLSFLRRYK